MDENTAQNNNTGNVTFQYPDFSNNQGAQQQSTPPTTNSNTGDDEVLNKLKESLNQMMAEDEKAKPTPQSPVTEPATPPLDEIVVEEGDKGDSSLDDVGGYVQEPAPLPNLDKSIGEENVSDDLPVPVVDFDPLPQDLPKFKESLDNIMPEAKKMLDEDGDNVVDEIPQVIEEEEPFVEETPAETPLVNKQNIAPPPSVGSPTSTPSSATTDSSLDIQRLLGEAVNRNASDLHLAVGYPPVLRIDGSLVNLDDNVLSPQDTEDLIFSVMKDEQKELLEVNREIDFAYTYEGATKARFRINAYYAMRNLSAAFRLIPSRIKTIEELMLPQLYHQFAKLKQGLILVTGPTGHGKSTTLAAILEDINRTRFSHIVTIEDPIEYVFEGKKALIDQREMNDDTHSWNIALRSALRQDPDVILVGEMRDFETIASAITLAETGHLVFATLHTNSAAQTLDRIIDVFPENQQQQVRTQVANTLQAVIAQRLIPLDKGGRRAVSEIMINNAAVSNLIREGKMHQVDNVIRTSSDIGMIYLEKSLVSLVREGVISVETAQEYAVHPEEVLRLMKV